MSGSIDVSIRANVANVVIKNPAKKNAMNQEMWIAMGDAVDSLQDKAEVRCIVIRGQGVEAFGSGADIDEFKTHRASKTQAIEFGRHGHRAMHAVRDCPIPTVAAIQGACVGGGLELAVGCDIRLASANARFGVPIARLGGVLAYPELEGLVRVAGPQVALELLLEGRILAADEAATKGIVSRVVPDDVFEDELERTVNRIVAGAPLSARLHKKFVRRLEGPAALSEEELKEGYACFDTEDFIEGWRSFLEKRPPLFKGR